MKKLNQMHYTLDNIKAKWDINDELEYEIRHAMANYAVSALLKSTVRNEAVQIASDESFEKFLNEKAKGRILIKD